MLKLMLKGLIPVIVQDAKNGEVLMLGYANKESLRRTLDSGEVWFYSRSRRELSDKGDTSGNVLKVRSIAKDCDGDAILVQAEPPPAPFAIQAIAVAFFRGLARKI